MFNKFSFLYSPEGVAATSAPAEAAPVEPASVADIPDVAADMTGQTFSFEQAIEDAIAASAVPVDPAAAAPIDPVAPVVDPAAPVGDNLEDLTDQPPADWTPKAASAFKRNKAEIRTLTETVGTNATTIQEQEIRIKELVAQVGDNTREALEAKVKAYEHTQMVNNLETSAAYNEAITAPLDAIADQATSIAERYGITPATLIDIMAMPDEAAQAEKLTEILVDANDRDKGRVYSLIDEVPAILARRKDLRENVQDATKEADLLVEQQETQRLADAVEMRTNVARNVAARIQQKIPFISEIDGVDLTAMETRIAQIDIAAANPVQQAYSNMTAQLFPTMVQELLRARAQSDHLTEKLAEFDQSEPSINPATTVAPPAGVRIAGVATAAVDPNAPVSFLDEVEKSIAAAAG